MDAAGLARSAAQGRRTTQMTLLQLALAPVVLLAAAA
jgi:hypothetical protein